MEFTERPTGLNKSLPTDKQTQELLMALMPFCRRVQLALKAHEHEFGLIFDERADFGSQLVGDLKEDRAAQRAGMRMGDCIVEVDGVNVCNESRMQCSERLAAAKQRRRVSIFIVESKGFQLCRDSDLALSSRWFTFLVPGESKKSESFNVTSVSAGAKQFFKRTKSTR